MTLLTHFGLNFDIDRLIKEVKTLLDSSTSIDTNKWKAKIDQLAPSWTVHHQNHRRNSGSNHYLRLWSMHSWEKKTHYQKSSHPPLMKNKILQVPFAPFMVQKWDYNWQNLRRFATMKILRIIKSGRKPFMTITLRENFLYQVKKSFYLIITCVYSQVSYAFYGLDHILFHYFFIWGHWN